MVGILKLINSYGRIKRLMLIVSFCFKTREETYNISPDRFKIWIELLFKPKKAFNLSI